ncbi:MAG: type II toxin-antitoxin system RelE/ParE family toxin [Alphaproteobacteria bacterium]
MKIESFRHKGLRRLYEDDDIRGLPPRMVGKIRNMLAALEAAATLEQVATFLGWRLHPLKGDRRGDYAMVVSRNMQLTFRVDGASLHDLDFEDYHE